MLKNEPSNGAGFRPILPSQHFYSKTTPYIGNGLKIMTKPGMYEGQPHQSIPPWHLGPIYGVVRHGQGHLFAFVRHALVSRYARHVEESSPAHAVLARGHACLVSWA